MDEFKSAVSIDWNGYVGTVNYDGGDKNMVVMFYTRPVHMPAKSKAENRPIYEDRTYVRIHPPGERLNIVDRAATEQDKRRWPLQWSQFAQNREQTPEGTPIDLLYNDKPSIAAMLKANGVHTIEQCAELSGPAIDNIGMGAQRYSNDAKKYLELSAKGVKASQLKAELEDRDREIMGLKHELELMRDELAALRNRGAPGIDLAALQAVIAQAQGRPEYPTVSANQRLASTFDAQTAQINAVRADTSQKPRRRRIQG